MNRISIKCFYQTNIRGHDTKKYQLFVVTIGNAKITEKIVYHPAAPVLEYHKILAKICCLSSLTSDFHSTGDNRDVTTLWNCIELLLELHTGKFRNRTNFAN